jgi:high affinity choline transporter 7
MLAETFWSAELLVALGSTLGVVLGIDLVTAILVSAAVVTIYTMAGGLWAVAWTDAFQLALVGIGLAVALPVALDAVGGLDRAWTFFQSARPDAARAWPPLQAGGDLWTRQAIVSWWDVSAMLVLGGIPWNCYFQRVLACRSAGAARAHSVLAGLLTMVLTVPPLLLGLAAFAYPWPAEEAARLAAHPANAVPLIFRDVTPPLIGLIGLAAIIGAVTSSFSSSILSAASMFSWNTCTRLINPEVGFRRLKFVMRMAIAALGVGAVWMALQVQSVQALWFFTSDLVFVLLFPQLVCALFDPRANLAGSIAAFSVSLVLRLGGGEPLFGIPALIPYPDIVPFRAVAAATGLVLLTFVSRLTCAWSVPRPLANVTSQAT